MKKLTVMLVPSQSGSVKNISVPWWLLRLSGLLLLGAVSVGSYYVIDYVDLKNYRTQYRDVVSENNHLKGEARVLIENLEEVKGSLRRIQDYSNKLTELVSYRVKDIEKKTGIGPLSQEEFDAVDSNGAKSGLANLPLGIKLDSLIFRPALTKLSTLEDQANRQALELKALLSTLGKKRSLLRAVPSISPVDGWITSNFGRRVSPFTGRSSMHRGIDIAAHVGTAIRAPANGVVIFSGRKSGFGNFVMIAHGYGIVTRYGHNAQNMVQVGQKVERGEQIATVGMSGRTTGPHLHYEVWVNGQTVSPRKFILDRY